MDLNEKIRMTSQEKTLLKRALSVLGTFTLITILMGLLAMIFTQKHQPLIVPKIIGMDQKQAEKALSSKGLHLNVTHSQFDEHIPKGLLMAQSPKANNYIKRGQTVTAVLSNGNPMVKVPSVLRMSFAQAQIALAGSRLRVVRESLVASTTEPKDTVMAQVPSPDDLVDSFTEVSLLVSSGPAEPAFVMPNLKNQPIERAFKILRPAGITIEKIKSEVHDDLESATVLSQTPAGGSRIKKKDAISFVVSAKTADTNLKARYAKVQFEMPEGNPRRLQIDVLDTSGTRTIYNRMESPKEKVEVGVSVAGKASAQVYLNQEFVKEIPID